MAAGGDCGADALALPPQRAAIDDRKQTMWFGASGAHHTHWFIWSRNVLFEKCRMR